MANAELPTAGNFTLDDYLQMVDNAENARGGSGESDDADGASVETNASATSRTSSLVADAAKKEEDIAPSLSGMGIDQILDVFAYLPLKDRTRVTMTSKHMLAQQAACDKSVRKLCVDTHHVGKELLANRLEEATRALLGRQSALDITHRSRQLQWSRLSSLRQLNVGKHCTDHFLEMISGGCHGAVDNERGDMLLPKLEVLKMSSSYHVSEVALMNLTTTDGSGRIRNNLQELDVTFCSNITYNAVIQFRVLLPKCLLRRLPQWMCGHTKTPFGENGRDEVHTYWPDGTFSYNRDHQSKGFVIRVDILSSQDHVSEKLQFIDLNLQERMPPWFCSGFRPSISLLRLEDNGNVDTQRVLVAQRKGGIKHLKYFPKVEQAEIVSLGLSKYFGLEGKCLSEEEVESSMGGRYFTMVMVSHMRKSKLKKEEQLSPLGLVRENALYLESTKDDDEEIRHEAMSATGIHNTEDMVHRSLGGIAAISEVEYDFKYNEDMVALPLNSNEFSRTSPADFRLTPF